MELLIRQELRRESASADDVELSWLRHFRREGWDRKSRQRDPVGPVCSKRKVLASPPGRDA